MATSQAEDYRDDALIAKDDAIAAKNDAIAAASVSGEFVFAESYAVAVAKLPLPEETIVEVGRDETRDSARTRYIVDSGELKFAVNLDLLRIELADSEHSGHGAAMVRHKQAGVGAVARTVQDKLRELAVSVRDYTSLATAISYAVSSGRTVTLYEDATVRIPTDCATLQRAVDHLFPDNPRVQITLRIDSGHQPASGISVTRGDYGQFTIRSVDPEVTLSPSFSGDSFVYADCAIAPVLGCLVNAEYRCDNGYYCNNASIGNVLPGTGVRKAKRRGLHGRSASLISAGDTIFTESGERTNEDSAGILAWGAVIHASGADVSDAKYYGAEAASGGVLEFRVGIAERCISYAVRATTASTVNASQASCKDHRGTVAVRSFSGSRVMAYALNADNAAGIGFSASSGSIIDARNSTARNCGGNAYTASTSSIINANESIADGSARGYCSLNASSVNANGSSAVGCRINAVEASGASSVSATGSNFSNCAGDTIFSSASNVDISGSDLRNSGGNSISARSGSTVNAYGSDTLFSGYAIKAITCTSGSTVSAAFTGLLPADTLPSTHNAITGNRGIIWV